jgi:hypothetical protein
MAEFRKDVTSTLENWMRGPRSRRQFLRVCGMALGLLVVRSRPAAALVRVRRRLGPHPMPRPGITADKVLARSELRSAPMAAEAFDLVREIPGVVDGIRCACGCAETEGYYSLLSCYEGDAMARSCPICQGQGRLVARMHKDGKALDAIRAAVDAKYG